MADRSKIEWTDASWNPIRARNLATGMIGWHCVHTSEGCRNCYAETMNKRLGTGLDYKPGNREAIDIFLDEKLLTQPLHWKRPRKIFVGSMTDLFADFVADDMLDRIFAVMALCPQHTFQLLTKRPERMRTYMTGYQSKIPYLGRMPLERIHIEAAGHMEGDGGYMDVLKKIGNIYSLYLNVPWPLPNVWLGVTAQDQLTADACIPDLLATPAAVRRQETADFRVKIRSGRPLPCGKRSSLKRKIDGTIVARTSRGGKLGAPADAIEGVN